MTIIRQLPENLINQIAAGEVIENPAAAVKELVENAIDAGASKISIDLRQAGKSLIIVTDNGVGMAPDDLKLCLSRHATSKLNTHDLLSIHSLGFRGEALPSIASVSRLKIESRAKGTNESWQISSEAGVMHDMQPSSLRCGTKIEIRDLFYATPARLKFLKSDQSEFIATKEVVNRLAMAYPDIEFQMTHDDRKSFHYQAEDNLSRIANIIGRDFYDNAMPVAIEQSEDDIQIEGYASLPTYNRGNAQKQFLFVNGRPVKDKLLLGVLRGAYADVLAGNRYPLVALFLRCPMDNVDVNVHPAKTEVRFKKPMVVRNMMFHAIQNAIREHSQQSASLLPQQTARFHNGGVAHNARHQTPPHKYDYATIPNFDLKPQSRIAETETHFDNTNINDNGVTDHPQQDDGDYPLGSALAQFHENYIVSQTKNGIILVDQHAAHERLVYEKMKGDLEKSGVKRQILLIPEIVNLPSDQANILIEQKDVLEKVGLVIEGFGGDAIIVREIPSILSDRLNIKKVVMDLADEVEDVGTVDGLSQKINHLLATLSCHGSVRSGRRLNRDEMNKLLREMEATPLSGQCNHGRPTMISLSLDDIERLFKRT